MKYTRNVYYIGNLEFARLVPGEAHFYNLDGDEIEKQTTEIKWDAEAAEKGGFEHFMMKEIHEQPKAVHSFDAACQQLNCEYQKNKNKRDGSLYFYCKFCHVSISEKDLWNGIHKELHQRMEEHKNLKKLIQKNSGNSNLETKKVALSREMEQVSGNIVRLESQKRSGYEQYVLGKLSKEKFLELKQTLENEIVEQKQEKSKKEKELPLIKLEENRFTKDFESPYTNRNPQSCFGIQF